jgi:outer membrane protein OmpA-like peptidoglycan-associated protein
VLHSHGQRDQRGDSPIGDAGPVDLLLQALVAHDPHGMNAALAPSVRLSIPTLRIHVMGRGEAAAALDAVIGAFSEVDYTVRSRYLNVTRVTDEAVISGIHTRPLLGAVPSYRQAKVPMRLIATHDGSVVTTIDLWPDVDAVRNICDELTQQLDSLAAKTGEMVSTLRASIPQPDARIVQGQEREEPDVDATLVSPPPMATRSPSRTEGLKAPVPSRTRRRQGIIAGAVMLVASAAIVGWVLTSVLRTSGAGGTSALGPRVLSTTGPTPSIAASGAGLGSSPAGTNAGALTNGQASPSATGPTPAPASPVAPAATQSKPLTPNKQGQVDLPTDLLFTKNKASLTPLAHKSLAGLIALVTKEHRRGKIYVDGYTDDTGTAAFNLRLSVARANAVADVLRSGLPRGTVVIARGHGVSDAKGANLDEETRRLNRRVMVTLPLKQAN